MRRLIILAGGAIALGVALVTFQQPSRALFMDAPLKAVAAGGGGSISFNAKSTSDHDFATTTALTSQSINWTTAATGTNICGVVVVAWNGAPGTLGTASLSGGVGNSVFQNSAAGTTNATVGIFGFSGLATSTAYTFSLSWATTQPGYVAGVSFNGCASGAGAFANFNSALGNTASATGTVTETNGASDGVVFIATTPSGGATVSSVNNTELFIDNNGTNNAGAMYATGTASPVTGTAALGAADHWVIAGVNVVK